MEKISKRTRKEMTEEEYFRDSTVMRDSILSNFDNLTIKDKHDLTMTMIGEMKQYKKSDFEILAELGRGSYSKVLKAKYIKDNKIKAIKVMDKDFMEKENKLYQVYLEADLLSKINHSLIIKCDGMFLSGKKIYLVLEYAENSDLSTFLKIKSIFYNEKFYFYYYYFVQTIKC